MEHLEKKYQEDVKKIQSLEIVPSILELICKTTGMGFAAVARVTDNKWIACAVKDEINFGLQPGGELQLETTICNEIRGHGQAVVIDEVSTDTKYANHHTPQFYGFESYISIPIFLKDGSFFGTLCAIDPKPRDLKVSDMLTMFNLYADLISFHLHSLDQAKVKASLLENTETKLQDSLDSLRQYEHISIHTLQEPLRKMQLYADMLITDPSISTDEKGKAIAVKINSLAADFSQMLKELTEYSEKGSEAIDITLVDLNAVVQDVIDRLQLKIVSKRGIVSFDLLHVIPGIQKELLQLFYYLIDNALNFKQAEIPAIIRIYSVNAKKSEMSYFAGVLDDTSYWKVCVEDNGIGIRKEYVDQIFDIFTKLGSKKEHDGSGIGLSQVKRIMKMHRGFIKVDSEPGKGTTFNLYFPNTPQFKP
jgi:signal transduction histidine kinase